MIISLIIQTLSSYTVGFKGRMQDFKNKEGESLKPTPIYMVLWVIPSEKRNEILDVNGAF